MRPELARVLIDSRRFFAEHRSVVRPFLRFLAVTLVVLAPRYTYPVDGCGPLQEYDLASHPVLFGLRAFSPTPERVGAGNPRSHCLAGSAPMLSSGWFGGREVAHAWFGVAPSSLALGSRFRGSPGCGNPWSRTVADEGSRQVSGATVDDVRLSLSADGSDLLVRIPGEVGH